MAYGNEVAGPAATSPLRHSVPHWYGLIPSRGMAGAGPAIRVHGILLLEVLYISLFRLAEGIGSTPSKHGKEQE